MGSGGTEGTTNQAPYNILGATGGESQHTQLEVELATHSHPSSTVGASTVLPPAHTYKRRYC